jgi:lysophospholipase L1-like esterase
MTTILCYGDSNTWGFDPATFERLSVGQRWPAALRRRLPGCEVVEEGLNGRTTIHDDPFEEGRNGLSYLAPCLASHAPIDLVILMLGTNDTKAMFPQGAPGIAAGVGRLAEAILRSARGPAGGAPQVLLVAPAPVTLPPTPEQEIWGFDAEAVERSRHLARYCRALAERLRIPFLDAGEHVQVSPVDGVHLDAAAQERLGAVIAERVAELLDPGARS